MRHYDGTAPYELTGEPEPVTFDEIADEPAPVGLIDWDMAGGDSGWESGEEPPPVAVEGREIFGACPEIASGIFHLECAEQDLTPDDPIRERLAWALDEIAECMAELYSRGGA